MPVHCVSSHTHSQSLAHVTQYTAISPMQAHSREWLEIWRQRAIIAQGKRGMALARVRMGKVCGLLLIGVDLLHNRYYAMMRKAGNIWEGIKGGWQGRLSDDLERLYKTKGYGYTVFIAILRGEGSWPV